MDEIELLLRQAWRRVKPKLLNNPDELARRLARRRSAGIADPVRAWCLAIRAADTRIDENQEPDALALRPHQVTLGKSLIRHLCAPVILQPPGEPWDKVARKLGLKPIPATLRAARINGIFEEHFVRHLLGRRGKAVPVLYCDRPLDPCARGLRNADPFWSWTATGLTNRLAEDFLQIVDRVPRFRGATIRHQYAENVHPEVYDSATDRPLLRMRPPPADYVSYKWRDGEYVGDAVENRLKAIRARRAMLARHRRREHPPERLAAGSKVFCGFQWICPKCGRTANTIYLPLSPVNLLEEKDVSTSPNVTKAGEFACCRCHRVQFLSRADANAWNRLVSTLSDGLLFGSDVPKPASLCSSAAARIGQ